jgi:hypothetical protein
MKYRGISKSVFWNVRRESYVAKRVREEKFFERLHAMLLMNVDFIFSVYHIGFAGNRQKWLGKELLPDCKTRSKSFT